MENKKENNYFYCYSNRLNYFLLSLKFVFVKIDINTNTNKRFWKYNKSEKLDDAISLYNLVKHKFN